MKFQGSLLIFAVRTLAGAMCLSIAFAGPMAHSAPPDKGSTPAKKPAPKTPADKKAADEAHKHALDKLKAENLDIFKTPGEFIVSLAKDHQGNIWVGTEDLGVFRFSPNAEANQQWRQFTTKDGLGDDNGYAIACDKLGRVWVGQLNHGVAVYNGDKWRVYDVLDGPIGERIFAITTCPVDGDVWMATSAGLTRYSLKDDTWSYYTRAEGLPSDQASSIAFAADGTIYVGTQCDGIAMASPEKLPEGRLEYNKWHVAAAPERFGPGECSPVPLEPAGAGLPTNLINQVLVASDGTVWAATTTGLAWSKDHGATWAYLRGKDYDDKVRGLYGGAPKGWAEAPKEIMDALLPADYVTCLAEDASGQLYVGFRQAGYVVIDPAKSHAKLKNAPQIVRTGTESAGKVTDNYITQILPMQDNRPYIGGYLGGFYRPKTPSFLSPVSPQQIGVLQKLPMGGCSLPTNATLLECKDANRMQRRIEAMSASPIGISAVYLGEDWISQGDWFGRHGRQHATLCAMAAPLDHEIHWFSPYELKARIGPHCAASGDSLRNWVHWMETNERRSLYDPLIKHRRQAEWDDHGEAYSLAFDGPDIWMDLKLPQGAHRLSMYFYNKDGHTTDNRFRDYLLEVRAVELGARDILKNSRVLARSRVWNFWGGEYKQFLLTGPGRYSVRIAREHSKNTIISGVFLDRIKGPPGDWSENEPLPGMNYVKYEAPKMYMDAIPPNGPDLPSTFWNLWQSMDEHCDHPGVAALMRPWQMLVYRGVARSGCEAGALGGWRWRIPVWLDWDREQFYVFMEKARQGGRDTAEPIDVETNLGGKMLWEYVSTLAVQFDFHYTIEENDKRLNESMRVYGNYDDPNISNIDEAIQRIQSYVKDGRIFRDKTNPAVVHLIAGELVNDANYPLNVNGVSIDYTEMRENLATEIGKKAKNLRSFGSKGTYLTDEFPSFDYRPIHVKANNMNVRSILTDELPLSDFDHLIWSAETSPDPNSPITYLKWLAPSNKQVPPEKMIPFTAGYEACYKNAKSDKAIQAAMDFIEMELKKDQPRQVRWAMLYLGKHKAEKAIPLLIKNIAYEYMPVPLIEEARPAVKALSLMGAPGAKAASEALKIETDTKKKELLEKVISLVKAGQVTDKINNPTK